MAYHGRATTNQNRPYQGYPYIEPAVTDAPSLNRDEVAALAKWQNLPVKKLITQAKSPVEDRHVIYIDMPEESNDEPTPIRENPSSPWPLLNYLGSGASSSRNDSIEDAPMVYIDIPQGSGSDVCERDAVTIEPTPIRENPSSPWPLLNYLGSGASSSRNDSIEDAPMVYIDIPQGSGSDVCERDAVTIEPTPIRENPSSPWPLLNYLGSGASSSRNDSIEDAPMVYIDIPQGSGSDVCERDAVTIEPTPIRENPSSPWPLLNYLGSGASSSRNDSIEDAPMVYIDIPQGSGSDVCERDAVTIEPIQSPIRQSPPLPSRPAPSQPRPGASKEKGNMDDAPMLYIDIPQGSGNDVCERVVEQQPMPLTRPPTRPAPTHARPGVSSSRKDSIDDAPMVYIDIPEGSGNDVCESRVEESTEPEYVQETIFYDPFKDRRIDADSTDSDQDSVISEEPASMRPAPHPPRPLPPNSFPQHLMTPGSSSGYATNTPSSVPPFLSKEANVYGRQPSPDDGFPLSPIPVSEFPFPPPAYEEIDRSPQSRPEPPRQQETQRPPPPVQVITNPNHPVVVGLPNQNRKFLNCPYCGTAVHTLAVRENGAITHFVAWFFMLCCLFPLTFLIYCTSCLKYRNHYCPNCNKKIGFEVPCCCTGMTYTYD